MNVHRLKIQNCFGLKKWFTRRSAHSSESNIFSKISIVIIFAQIFRIINRILGFLPVPFVDTTFRRKSVRVGVLGAHTPTGEATAFLLKQNPIVSQIYLHGTPEVMGIAADLRHIDTRSEVKAYHGDEGVAPAVRVNF